MHPLYGALSRLYVAVPVTRGASVAHLYTYAHPHCRTSQYSSTFITLTVSVWKDLGDPVVDAVGLAGFKSRDNAFLQALMHIPFFLLLFSLSLLSFNGLVSLVWGLRTDRVLIALPQPCIANLF